MSFEFLADICILLEQLSYKKEVQTKLNACPDFSLLIQAHNLEETVSVFSMKTSNSQHHYKSVSVDQ